MYDLQDILPTNRPHNFFLEDCRSVSCPLTSCYVKKTDNSRRPLPSLNYYKCIYKIIHFSKNFINLNTYKQQCTFQHDFG